MLIESMPINREKKPFTYKEGQFMEAWAKTANAADSAKKVFHIEKPVLAHAIGTELLDKPAISFQIQNACDRAGITPDTIILRLKMLLEEGHPFVVFGAIDRILRMTGWVAPTTIDQTVRLSSDGERLLNDFS